jgi:hypothetical protein
MANTGLAQWGLKRAEEAKGAEAKNKQGTNLLPFKSGN